jgi:hypothetical protein
MLSSFLHLGLVQFFLSISFPGYFHLFIVIRKWNLPSYLPILKSLKILFLYWYWGLNSVLHNCSYYYCTGGTLWHLQKLLRYVIVKLTPLITLLYPLSGLHNLQGRCFTTSAMPLAIFARVILEIGSHFLPKLAWTMIPLFYTSCCCALSYCFPLWWDLANVFCPGWPGTSVLLISASRIAWDDRHMAPYPAIGGDGGLTNILPRLSSNLDLSLPSR